MFCGACGTENADGAKFCKGCGHPLSQASGAVKKAGSLEEENAVLEIPKAGKPQMKEERKPMPKKILAVTVLAAVMLAAVLWFAVSAGSMVNLDEYLTVETDGYDGYGTATAEIDWDTLEKNCGGKVSFTEKAKNEYGGFTNMMTPAEMMREYIKVELDHSDHLSNGDEIAYTWEVDEDFSKYLKCKLKYKDGTHDVSDLEEVETFDAFADLEVTFSGVGPNGNVELEYKGTQLDGYDFSCDKDSGLSNGDTVTVSISDENLSDYAERIGKVPETLEKTYKVEGLQHYLTSMSEIGEEDLKAMQQQASDVFHAYVARDWVNTTKLKSFDYVGTYFLTAKNPETVRGSQNALYLVYKIRAKNIYSNGEETFDKTSDVYWYLSYSDLLAGTDGRLAMDLSDYGTPNESYVVDSGISDGWFGTYSWYYDGYGTLDALYKDVVTSNADAYNHEDHVDGNASSEKPGENADEEDGTAYILPDSNTKLLSEKDLEELSDEECKLARNEIYARHGRKFKDEKLQAYFDACDWYKGTIEPDDFEESLLSEVEIANRDLLVAYEEKRNKK